MKYSWLVEKYLEGDMKDQELKDFELLMLKDPEIAEEVDRVRSLLTFCREQHAKLYTIDSLIGDFEDQENTVEAEDLDINLDSLKVKRISEKPDHKDLLKKIRRAYGQDERKSFRLIPLLRYNLWLTAASFALVLAVSAVLLGRGLNRTDPLALYRHYYSPYLPETTVRSPGLTTQNYYQAGLAEYRNANYSLALEHFTRSLEENPGSPYAHLFMGLIMMEMEDFERALYNLQYLETDRALDDFGLWYSALCHLRLSHREQAVRILKKLVKDNSYFAPRARSLLREM